MTADDETLARIRAALDDEERVDARRVEVHRDDQGVVLRGAVATPEEATAATMVAELDTASVRNELRVDPGLREATSAGAAPPVGAPPPAPQRSPEDPSQPADDLTPHVEEALGENLAWDPPEAPVLAPTRAEERGSPAGEAGRIEDPAPDDADEAPSAADLSAAELRRTARPDSQEER